MSCCVFFGWREGVFVLRQKSESNEIGEHNTEIESQSEDSSKIEELEQDSSMQESEQDESLEESQEDSESFELNFVHEEEFQRTMEKGNLDKSDPVYTDDVEDHYSEEDSW